jgi:vitamin B12 transporter
MSPRYSSAVSLLLSSSLAFAASAAHAETILDERAIVVTATRVPTPLDEVLPTTIVIDRRDVARSLAADAADLLRFRAGLDLSRNGGPGQSTSLFIRGADSNHTLVMVDGVRINPGTIGNSALQNLSPELIERIEVVKGPRSSLYGTDAIGGVINVITRRGARDGWSAQLGYGADDTREASLSGGVAGSAAELDFGVDWIESDGFPTLQNPAVRSIDRGYDNLSLNVRGRTELGRSEIALGHWQATGNTEYFDYFLTPVDQDYENSTTTLSAALPVGSKARLSAAASYFADEIEQQQSPDYLRTKRYSLDAQLDAPVGELHRLTAGVLYSDENAESLSFGDSFDEDTRIWNVFLQDRMQFGRQRATLAAAWVDHETFGSEVTWNVDYGFAFTSRLEMVLAAGTGFRAPDATDRFGFGGNPALDPERSRSYSAELRLRPADRHAVRLAAFENDIEDLIEFVTVSFDPFFGENRNVGEARIRGIEAGYEYASVPWQVRVEATFQDPENRATGEQLLRRPKESATFSAVRTFGRFDLGVDVLAAGERKDFGFPEPVDLDAYVLANLTAGWRITDALSLRVRIENLFDEDYELADGYNTAGLGAFVAVRYAPGARNARLAGEDKSSDGSAYSSASN